MLSLNFVFGMNKIKYYSEKCRGEGDIPGYGSLLKSNQEGYRPFFSPELLHLVSFSFVLGLEWDLTTAGLIGGNAGAYCHTNAVWQAIKSDYNCFVGCFSSIVFNV